MTFPEGCALVSSVPTRINSPSGPVEASLLAVSFTHMPSGYSETQKYAAVPGEEEAVVSGAYAAFVEARDSITTELPSEAI